MKSKVLALLALGPLSLSLAATAATITYSDEATFTSATGSAMLTLPDANNVDLLIAAELSIKQSAVGGFFAGSHIATYWDKAPNYTVKNGIESFDLIPLKSIYAIGFSLYEPTAKARLNGCNKPTTACVEATFQVELFSGLDSLGEYTIKPPNDLFNFYGFWTADPITKVTIREAVVTSPYGDLYSDDNEFFGRFTTGTTSNVAVPPAVPLPAAAWLLLSGLGGLGFLGRRKAV